jgi:hypothetical protein
MNVRFLADSRHRRHPNPDPFISWFGHNAALMQTFIKNLGKPRSWLVFTAACLAGLLLGALCVGLYFSGWHPAGQIGFWIVAACWVSAAFSCISYFFGQLSGRYRDLRGKSWAELPW